MTSSDRIDPAERRRKLGRSSGRDLGGRLLPARSMPCDQLGVPPVPEQLGEAGRSAWLRLWTAAAWLSPDTDVDAAALYCAGLDQWQAMRDRIAADELVTRGSERQPRPHPLLVSQRALEAQLSRWQRALGFTPVARSALGGSEVRRLSRLDELAARRRAGPP